MYLKLRNVRWIFLLLVSICAILFIVALFYWHLELKLRILFAREQVQIFESMREKAYTGNVHQAINCLEYTINYYPSGTKQVQGSPLDEIVEISRKMVIDDIIASLRQKSNSDFGTDPNLWIKNHKLLEREK
jgi:hypothetical protein